MIEYPSQTIQYCFNTLIVESLAMYLSYRLKHHFIVPEFSLPVFMHLDGYFNLNLHTYFVEQAI